MRWDDKGLCDGVPCCLVSNEQKNTSVVYLSCFSSSVPMAWLLSSVSRAMTIELTSSGYTELSRAMNGSLRRQHKHAAPYSIYLQSHSYILQKLTGATFVFYNVELPCFSVSEYAPPHQGTMGLYCLLRCANEIFGMDAFLSELY